MSVYHALMFAISFATLALFILKVAEDLMERRK
ncbi:hypothetical protein CEB3_c26700 [Peptococcaceae bacterium CEB3]|nr:hypothetical protein CEB3_c26700 [Peptococcaceae bacterium CEB3]